MTFSLFEDLVSVLSAQLDLYDQLVALSDAEREALVSREPEVVFDLVRRKETLLLRLRTVEESRELLCLRLARQEGTKAAELTLSEIQRRCPEAVLAARLGELRETLRETVKRIQEQNARNAGLCHQGIDLIGEVLHASGQPAGGGRAAGGYGLGGRSGAGVAPGCSVVRLQVTS
jgi:flagellar biosynthesis/type III secretory pathway chaperone